TAGSSAGTTGQRSGYPRQCPARSGTLSELAKTNLVSRQDLDTQLSLVQQTEGAIKADQGSVDSAKLQITYSRITAPIDGRVGLKLVDVGNYITSGSTTGIVVITQTHPIDVVFTLPEATISDLIKAQKAGP